MPKATWGHCPEEVGRLNGDRPHTDSGTPTPTATARTHQPGCGPDHQLGHRTRHITTTNRPRPAALLNPCLWATPPIPSAAPFAYITGELADSGSLTLMRLHYDGSATRWGFAVYLASKEGYERAILATGDFTGTPEYLLDTAWTSPAPDELTVLTTYVTTSTDGTACSRRSVVTRGAPRDTANSTYTASTSRSWWRRAHVPSSSSVTGYRRIGATARSCSLDPTVLGSSSPARFSRPSAERTSASMCAGACREWPAIRRRTAPPRSLSNSRSTSAEASSTASAMMCRRLVPRGIERIQSTIMRHMLRGRRRQRGEPSIGRARGKVSPDGFLGHRGEIQARLLGLRREVVREVDVQPSHTTHYTHFGPTSSLQSDPFIRRPPTARPPGRTRPVGRAAHRCTTTGPDPAAND